MKWATLLMCALAVYASPVPQGPRQDFFPNNVAPQNIFFGAPPASSNNFVNQGFPRRGPFFGPNGPIFFPSGTSGRRATFAQDLGNQNNLVNTANAPNSSVTPSEQNNPINFPGATSPPAVSTQLPPGPLDTRILISGTCRGHCLVPVFGKCETDLKCLFGG